MFLGAASASVGGKTHLLLGAGREGHDVPCSKCMCALNAAIPAPHCSPLSHHWPIARVQGKALQERCGSTAFPGLARCMMWWGKLHCCGTLALPRFMTRHSPSLLCSPGRQQDELGREAAPIAAKPRPKGSSPGPHLWPWQSRSCLHGHHVSHHCPCWAQPGSWLRQERGDLFKQTKANQTHRVIFFSFLSS